jgi:peptidoglycan/xylan/chitin deacetylase (PgdA/CDA1 family)
VPNVALTFDFDALSLWIGSMGAKSPGMTSRGEFGPKGVARLLELLGRHELQATFFVPGHTALAYPDCVRAIADAGHEIGHHGFVHERVSDLTPAREREVFEKGVEALIQVAGVTPVGYRSPSWDFSEFTPHLLAEQRLLYDSSLMGSDFSFYWPRCDDRAPADGPYHFGPEIPVVEVPISWVLDDFVHFEYIRGGLGPGLVKSPDEVYDLWIGEFDFFAESEGMDCFTLTMHPQVIGRGPRIRMLERLIIEMRARANVRFASLSTFAAEWKQRQERVPSGS